MSTPGGGKAAPTSPGKGAAGTGPASPKAGAAAGPASPKAGAAAGPASPKAGAAAGPASPKASAAAGAASAKAGAAAGAASPKAGAAAGSSAGAAMPVAAGAAVPAILSFLNRERVKKATADGVSLTGSGGSADPSSLTEGHVDHGLETAQLRFLLQCGPELVSAAERAAVEVAFLDNVKAESMVAYYASVCEAGLVKSDAALVASLKAKNASELAALQSKEKDMVENHGEVELMEAQLKTATFLALTGTQAEAVAAFDKVSALKSTSTGQLLDIVLRKIRLGFVWMDTELIASSIAAAEKLLEKGGDWDRRNRLKVYRGLYQLVSRNFAAASEDLLSAVATFTSTELCTYETFIFYTVVTAMVALGRVAFKTKVIDSPEVAAVVRESAHLQQFLHSLHECDYKGFMSSLVLLNAKVCTDRYLATHSSWLYREVRVKAYVQFLESYKSVQMQSMAASFGLSVPFLEKELAHFISTRRINAKIDKVAGVVETCQPNETNARYQSVIKQGDLLLNRVQMLSRAINI